MAEIKGANMTQPSEVVRLIKTQLENDISSGIREFGNDGSGNAFEDGYICGQRAAINAISSMEFPEPSCNCPPVGTLLTVTYNVDDVREEVREGEGLLTSDWEWTNEGTRRNYEALKAALEQYDKEQA